MKSNIDTSWDIMKYKYHYELEHEWELKRKFIEAHKAKYPEDRLICLAQLFCNVHFMGCSYEDNIMKLIRELSAGIAEKNTKWEKQSFVSASDAVEDRVKNRLSASQRGPPQQQQHTPVPGFQQTNRKNYVNQPQNDVPQSKFIKFIQRALYGEESKEQSKLWGDSSNTNYAVPNPVEPEPQANQEELQDSQTGGEAARASPLSITDGFRAVSMIIESMEVEAGAVCQEPSDMSAQQSAPALVSYEMQAQEEAGVGVLSEAGSASASHKEQVPSAGVVRPTGWMALNNKQKRHLKKLLSQGTGVEEARRIVQQVPSESVPDGGNRPLGKGMDVSQETPSQDQSSGLEVRIKFTSGQRKRFNRLVAGGMAPAAARLAVANSVPRKPENSKRPHSSGGTTPEDAKRRTVDHSPGNSSSTGGPAVGRGAGKSFSQALTGRKVGILHREFPSFLLTSEQMDLIQESIVQGIRDLPLDGPKPAFLSASYRRGWLCLTCADDGTVAWLRELIVSCTPWEGARLYVAEGRELPRPRTAMAFLPGCARETSEGILQLLERQNRGLKPRSWTILNRTDTGPNVLLNLIVDEESAKTLEGNPGVHVCLGQGTIRVKRVPPESSAQAVASRGGLPVTEAAVPLAGTVSQAVVGGLTQDTSTRVWDSR